MRPAESGRIKLPEFSWQTATCPVCGETFDYLSRRRPRTCNTGECRYKYHYGVDKKDWASYQPTLFEKGNLLTLMGQTDEAIATYTQLLNMNFNVPKTQYNLAFALKKQGSYNKAIEIYKTVIKNNPNHKHALLGLAHSYLLPNILDISDPSNYCETRLPSHLGQLVLPS